MLPHLITGDSKNPILVLIAGFPDDEISGERDQRTFFFFLAYLHPFFLSFFLLLGWAPVIDSLKNNYYIISVCFPGNEKNGKPKPWGYEINEVVDMLEFTLNKIITNQSNQRYTLITHDWGAIIGYIYENRYPSKVIQMISLDIGLDVKPRFRIFFYQSWYAVCYIISQIFGQFIAKIPFFFLALLFHIFPILSPLGMPNDQPHRPISELRPDMCYPYYYIWKYLLQNHWKKLLTLNEDIPIFFKIPSCPLLFMVR